MFAGPLSYFQHTLAYKILQIVAHCNMFQTRDRRLCDLNVITFPLGEMEIESSERWRDPLAGFTEDIAESG